TLPQEDLFHHYLIADYLFAKDKLFASLNLEQRDWVLYQRVSTLLERELRKPDLVVYIQSSTTRLLTNIKQRNRPYEKAVSEEYIRALNETYNSFFFHYNQTPLLVVNASEIDFVNNREDLEDMIPWIENPPAGVKYYVPQKR
ncbi:MAG TPA: deoxynucleoside kinase, partial [bacterium]